jgi:YVTN family beta-propeller protein
LPHGCADEEYRLDLDQGCCGDDSALVANQGSAKRPDNRVCLVSIDGKAPVRHIVTGAGAHGVALSPDGSRAFITNTVANTLTVIDVAGAVAINSWPTGKAPNGVIAR